jgi:hypothetical protein
MLIGAFISAVNLRLNFLRGKEANMSQQTWLRGAAADSQKVKKGVGRQ